MIISDSRLARSRYNLYENGEPKTELPLLSRGEREIDDEDEFEDNVKIPSCSELRKMWKIARRIHHHAIKTNEIPQKLHPFSNFESDRFRASQRFKNKHLKYSNRKNVAKSNKPMKGSKEVAETNYGIVRYSPLDPVKRPGSGEKVYDVLRKMNPDISYAKEKDPGAWATKIVQFEPEKSIVRPFDTLRNRLREEKKLPPMPERGVGHRKEYWGNIVTHYKNKGNEKSNLDLVKDELLSDSHRSPSRLNYRDDTSAAIVNSGDTTFGRRWNSRDSSKKKNRRRNKKRKKGRKKKFRNNKNYKLQNFLMKGHF